MRKTRQQVIRLPKAAQNADACHVILADPSRTLDVLIPSGLRMQLMHRFCMPKLLWISSLLCQYPSDCRIFITRLPYSYRGWLWAPQLPGLYHPVALKEPRKIKASPGQHPAGPSRTTVDRCYTDGRPCVLVRPLSIYVMTTVCHPTSILLATPENARPPVPQSQRYESSLQTLSWFSHHEPCQC
jgi:hypothetical protein